MNDEFMEVKKEREHLLSKYDDYRSTAHRSRRSLLPIVGNALSYLFGVTSEDDLRVISRALARLTNTQGRLLHVMEDSVSVINVTSRSLLKAAQNNTIKTNHTKAKIDNTQQNCKCRLCGDKDEMIDHIICE